MTFVQVLADRQSVYMCCDFRLTDSLTGRVVDNNAHKLVNVVPVAGDTPIPMLIGATGLGSLGGLPVATWIARQVVNINLPTLDAALEHLKEKLEPELLQVPDPRQRRHTLVVAAIEGTHTRISLVSNFEQIVNGRVQRSGTTQDHVMVTGLRPSAPFYLTVGSSSVPAETKQSLRNLVANRAGSDTVLSRLAEVNVAASTTDTMVSAGCDTAALHAKGEGRSRPFFTDEQQGDFIPPAFEETLRQLKLQLNRAVDADGKPLPIRAQQIAQGWVSGSETSLKRQTVRDPDDADAWNNLGAQEASRRKFSEARQSFKRALEIDPNHVVARANLAKRTCQDLDDAAAAIGMYREILDTPGPPPASWILKEFADVLTSVGSAEARPHYERAAADPSYPLGRAALARYQAVHAGEAEAAAEAIALLLRELANPEPWVLALAAHVAIVQKDYESAMHRLQRACQGNPTDAKIWLAAGKMSLHLGDPSSASYYLRKAHKRGANPAQFEHAYGTSLLLSRKFQGAVRHLARAHRLAGGATPATP
ncbi:MAG: tetratricopeptide repeat protein [Nocardioidaceae bacterium]|nr:MAG: tetratricopeptide repeat protein [Nocardioidaceae bacterium]